MVILDETYRSTMLANGHHYIQPEPVSPTEAAMDVKSSPLAMLQKTCSSIGADTSPVKPSASENKKAKEDHPRKSSPQAASPARKTPTTFRPYDLDRKPEAKGDSGDKSAGEDSAVRGAKSPGRSPDSRKTRKSEASATSSSAGSSPITRPGSEVLAGVSSKDLHSLGYHKPGTMPLQLPQYLPAEMVSAALRPTLPTLPGLYTQPGLSPVSYLSLQHHQQHRLGEKCGMPFCMCAFSAAPHGLGASCPGGCSQCEHAKVTQALSGTIPSPYLTLGSPLYPPSSLGLGMTATAAGQSGLGLGMAATAGGQPIVCSWMSEGRYCGKRFSSTDELMQHLRTHTNLSSSEGALHAVHPAYHASLLAAHKSPFGPPTLSPLSAGRYHPYAKPPAPGALGLGPHHPGVLAAGFYSPYSAFYARPPVLP